MNILKAYKAVLEGNMLFSCYYLSFVQIDHWTRKSLLLAYGIESVV